MKTITKFITLPLLLAGISFISITCKEKPPQEPETTYYDVVGIGYVFMCDNAGNVLYPIERAKITVYSIISWRLHSFSNDSPEEVFFSDATGKYQVRFIKHFRNDDVERYSIVEECIGMPGRLKFSSDEIKNAQQIIELDTFKLYKSSINTKIN